MKLAYRPIALGVFALVFSALVFERARAGGEHYFAPVTDPIVKEECGSCHLAFPPSLLPASSWKRMMGDLAQHFGDDASVDAKTQAHITSYLVANAGSSGTKLLRGAATPDAGLRITELPAWVREHRKVSAREWKDPQVRSKANCLACHVDAARGIFDD